MKRPKIEDYYDFDEFGTLISNDINYQDWAKALEKYMDWMENQNVIYDRVNKRAVADIDNLEQQIKGLKAEKSFPTEDEMYDEMNRKFDLGKNHDEGMQIDDTQIGWENCYDWIKQALTLKK